jgi:hypothetical protein
MFMKTVIIAGVVAQFITGCGHHDDHASFTTSGHHLDVSAIVTTNLEAILSVTLSNSSDRPLSQVRYMGARLPPCILRVFSTSFLNGELELPLAEAETEWYLRGEVWENRHPPEPMILRRGESTSWTYNLTELFQRVTNRTYRIEFVPCGLNGFGKTNFNANDGDWRCDLACSNLLIKIKK